MSPALSWTLLALGILAVGVLGATTGQIMAMKLSTTSRHAVLAMQLTPLLRAKRAVPAFEPTSNREEPST